MTPEQETDVGAQMFQDGFSDLQKRDPILKSLSCVWRKKGNKVSIKLLLRTNSSE